MLFYECIYNKVWICVALQMAGLMYLQRPFEGSTQTSLAAQISQACPKFPVTAPPVSMPCLHAISSALEEDPAKRMGSASFLSFTDNPFFRDIDFEALERKEIEPVFVPSSEKTNFDATYDLEELLLEEAPLEARARRQKPREQLKDDATEKEIREDELYRMIENMFLPFDYTTAAYDRYAFILIITRRYTDKLLDMPEPWIRTRPTLQPTGHNLLQCINSKKLPRRRLSLQAPARDEERTQSPNHPPLQAHHPCPHIPRLCLMANRCPKAPAPNKATTVIHPTKAQWLLLFHHISNLTAGRRDLRAQGRSLWEVECRSCWTELGAGLS